MVTDKLWEHKLRLAKAAAGVSESDMQNPILRRNVEKIASLYGDYEFGASPLSGVGTDPTGPETDDQTASSVTADWLLESSKGFMAANKMFADIATMAGDFAGVEGLREGGKAGSEFFERGITSATELQSRPFQEALGGDDLNATKAGAALLGVVPMIPSFVTGAGALGAAGRMVGGRAIAGAAGRGIGKSTELLARLAGRGAAQASALGLRVGPAGAAMVALASTYGAFNALAGGGDTYSEAYDEAVRSIDLSAQTRSLSSQEKDRLAREIAREAAKNQMPVAAITGAIGLGGAAASGAAAAKKMLAKKAATPMFMAIAKGATLDAGSEAAEEGFQGYNVNVALREVDPSRDPFHGVRLRATLGALAGGLLGGGVSGIENVQARNELGRREAADQIWNELQRDANKGLDQIKNMQLPGQQGESSILDPLRGDASGVYYPVGQYTGGGLASPTSPAGAPPQAGPRLLGGPAAGPDFGSVDRPGAVPIPRSFARPAMSGRSRSANDAWDEFQILNDMALDAEDYLDQNVPGWRETPDIRQQAINIDGITDEQLVSASAAGSKAANDVLMVRRWAERQAARLQALQVAQELDRRDFSSEQEGRRAQYKKEAADERAAPFRDLPGDLQRDRPFAEAGVRPQEDRPGAPGTTYQPAPELQTKAEQQAILEGRAPLLTERAFPGLAAPSQMGAPRLTADGTIYVDPEGPEQRGRPDNSLKPDERLGGKGTAGAVIRKPRAEPGRSIKQMIDRARMYARLGYDPDRLLPGGIAAPVMQQDREADEEVDSDLSDEEIKARDVYATIFNKLADSLGDAQPTAKQRQVLSQLAELIDNPSRYGPVLEAKNPLGIKIGDTVIADGTEQTVLGIQPERGTAYGGFSVHVHDGGWSFGTNKAITEVSLKKDIAAEKPAEKKKTFSEEALSNALGAFSGKKDEKPKQKLTEKEEDLKAKTSGEPTEAQKEAGNYKKEHIRMHGLDIAIENPRGSVRRGKDDNGKEWENELAHDYGYIKRTEGNDGDHVDVFIGTNLSSDKVFVVNQTHKDGKFDEHKVMLGFSNAAAAEAGYLANYDKGWDNYDDIVQMSVEEFKAWLNDGDQKKPARSGLKEKKITKQPRDRSGAASIAQMADIAKNPDYDRLGPSRSPESGAPMVFIKGDVEGVIPDNQFGDTDIVTMSDGKKIKVRYAVVNASQVIASNNADGSVVEEYDNPDDGSIVALNNGRIAGLRSAWRTGAAEVDQRGADGEPVDSYVNKLLGDYKGHKIDMDVISDMAQPILVRVYADSDNYVGIGDASNKSQSLEMSPGEQARADARLIEHFDDLSLTDDGDLLSPGNHRFVQRFLGSMSKEERGGLVNTDGTPNKDLRARIEAAVFWAAYKNKKLLSLQAESADPEIKNVISAMMIAAPRFAKLDGSALELGEVIASGAALYRSLRASGVTNVDEHLSTQDILGERDPDADYMARLLAANNRSQRRLADMFIALADYSEQLANAGADGGMFGDIAPASMKEAFLYATQRVKEKYPDAPAKTRSQQGSLIGIGGFESRAQADERRKAEQGDEPVSPAGGSDVSGKPEKVEGAETGTSEVKNKAAATRPGSGGKVADTVFPPDRGYATKENLISGMEKAGLDPSLHILKKINDAWIATPIEQVEPGKAFGEVSIHEVDTPDGVFYYVVPENGVASIMFAGPTEHAERLGGRAVRHAKDADGEDVGPGFKMQNKDAADEMKNILENGWTYKDNTSGVIVTKDLDAKKKSAKKKAAEPKKAKGYGESNKVFTKNDLDDAIKKLGGGGTLTANPLFDPQRMMAAVTIVGYHVEAGFRTFADAVRAVAKYFRENGHDFDQVKPFLKGAYKQVSSLEGFDDLDSDESVNKSNIDDLLVEGGSDAVDTGVTLEQGGRDAGAGERMGQDVLPTEPAGAGAGDATAAGGSGRGVRSGGGERVPGGSPAAGGKGGVGPVRAGESAVPGDVSGGSVGQRGTGRSDQRVQDQRVTDEAVKAASREVVTDAGRIREIYRDADKIRTVTGDIDNIRATLPTLLQGQQDDVKFTEDRFAKPDGQGVMFTNGTGTGKTFTGLGVIKRFAREGKTRILISVPSAVKADWIRNGRNMGLTISELGSTKDKGVGIVITTHENMGDNDKIAEDTWDLILVDESHKLSANKEGDLTKAGRKLRALSYQPAGYVDLAESRYPDDKAAWMAAMSKLEMMNKGRAAHTSADYRAANDRLDETRRKWESRKEEMKSLVNGMPKQAKPKVLMLSATPFSYRESVSYADGLLFDMGSSEKSGYNQPSPREQFFITHFGYRYRYGKLAQPDESKIDVSLLEVSFNNWLRTTGALSSRTLDVPFDYDRKFITVDDLVGNKIDEGLTFLQEDGAVRYKPLYDAIEENFGHQEKLFLLESIKAKHAVDMVKDLVFKGRKVVIFHDFNKGGGFHPFKFKRSAANDEMTWSVGGKTYSARWNDIVDSFNKERPDLVNLDLEGLKSPIETFKKEFGGSVLFYNGLISARDAEKAKELFNTDNNEYSIILVQSDKGSAGLSLHDTSGEFARASINLGLPLRPVKALQSEGRTYRTGQASNALQTYLTTGTSFETRLFTETIAKRADTAENLGQGAEARDIRASFVDGYAEAASYKDTPLDGAGGKERDMLARQGRGSQDPFEQSKTHYWANLKNTGRRDQREGVDYFPTPEPLGFKMVAWAKSRAGESSLEPSVGHGAIGRYLPDDTRKTIIDPSVNLIARAGLVAKAQRTITGMFEDYDIVNKHDVIVMNPPWGVGGSTAIEHLSKAALKHLRKGGRVVALIPAGPAADKRFDAFMSSKEAKDLHLVATIQLPMVTFERAGTSVSSRVVVIDNAPSMDPAKRIDLASVGDINVLFDRIKNIEMPERPVVEASEEEEAVEKPKKQQKQLTLVGKKLKNGKPIAAFSEQSKRVAKADWPRFSSFARDNGAVRWVSINRDPNNAIDSEGIPVQGFEFRTEQDRDNFIAAVGENQKGETRFKRKLRAEKNPNYKERPDMVAMSDEQAVQALQKDATARRILAKGNRIANGDRVGIRLNINVLKSTGVAVQTVHAGKNSDGYTRNRGWWDGEVLTYKPVVTLRNAYFNVGQKAREEIATGGGKMPMASIDGLFSDVTPRFDGVEVSFNPGSTHLFVDADGRAIAYADEVTIMGHRAYVRGNVEYYESADAPARAGGAASKARFIDEPDLALRAVTGVGGSTVEAVKATVSRISGSWKDGPRVRVVQSESELPVDIREAIAREGAEGEIHGVFHNGAVYLVADNIPNDADAEITLLHEAVGHYGMRSLLGASYVKFLDQVLLSYAGTETLARIAKTYGYSMKNRGEALKIADELVAHMAETGERPGLLRQLIAMLRKWLRDMGMNNALTRMTDADIRAMLAIAERRMRTGSALPSASLAMRKASAGTRFNRDGSERVRELVGRAVSFWREIAKHDRTARYKMSESKDLADILAGMDPGISVKSISDSPKLVRELLSVGDETGEAYRISMPKGGMAAVVVNRKAGTVYTNTALLDSGRDGSGGAIYQGVANFALNNGLKFIGDPAGVSKIAQVRRIEHAISFAMRAGTTKAFMPAKETLSRENDPVFPGRRPMGWRDGDEEYNLRSLLVESYTNVAQFLPEIENVVYDPNKWQFVWLPRKGGPALGVPAAGRRTDGIGAGEVANVGARRTHESAGRGGVSLEDLAWLDSLPHGVVLDRGSLARLGDIASGRFNYRVAHEGLKGPAKENAFGGSTIARAAVTNTALRSGSAESWAGILDTVAAQLEASVGIDAFTGIRFRRTPGEPTSRGGETVLFRRVRDIDFSPLMPGSFELDQETLYDTFVRKVQDKLLRLKRAQEKLVKQFGQLPDELNAYRAEELMHGRVETMLRSFEKAHVDPLVKAMSEEGVDQEALDWFLYASHAKERNKHIREIHPDNPDMQDGGSGMTDEQADERLAEFDRLGMTARMKRLAQMVYAMNEARISIIEKYGLEDPATIAKWRKYRNYVPLKGKAGGRDGNSEGEFDRNIGSGVSVRGKESYRSFGRGTVAESPLLHTIAQVENSILRAERNRVGRTFLDLVTTYPDENMWKVVTPHTERRTVYNSATGSVETVPDYGLRNRDDIFTLKVNGVEKYILVKDALLLRALKNLGPEPLNMLTRGMGWVNRKLAAFNTSLNPEFVISNAFRDLQTALFNLEVESSKKDGLIHGQRLIAKTIKDIAPAMRGIWQVLRDKEGWESNPWASSYEEFRALGGQIGFFGLKDFESRAEDLQRMLDEANGDWAAVGKKGFRELRDLIYDGNAAVENAVRLSAFVNARDAMIADAAGRYGGASNIPSKEMIGIKERAASLAKNITVNFNRKGEWGSMINSMYLFANASIQGTAQFRKVIFTKKGGAIASTLILGAWALAELNRVMAGDDDDDQNLYEKVPDHVKDRNLVIMKWWRDDGSFMSVPLPYGYNVFHVFGTAISDKMHGKPSGAVSLRVMGALLGAFSPLGSESSENAATFAAKLASPTILDPAVQLATNENFFGQPIYNEGYRYSVQRPDSSLYWKSTGEVSKWLAKTINAWGGSEHVSGNIDISPDSIEHIFDFTFGGAGAFYRRTAVAIEQSLGDEPVDPNVIPFARRVSGQVSDRDDQARYYNRRDKVRQYEEELKAVRQDGAEAVAEWRKKNGAYASMFGITRDTENKIRGLRDQRRRIDSAKVPDEMKRRRLKEIDAKIEEAVDRYNKAYNNRVGED